MFELVIPMISVYGRGHPAVRTALSQQAQIQSMGLSASLDVCSACPLL
jgi:hypothetical protein